MQYSEFVVGDAFASLHKCGTDATRRVKNGASRQIHKLPLAALFADHATPDAPANRTDITNGSGASLIGNDFTFLYGTRRFRIAPKFVLARMRGQEIRVAELSNGKLMSWYEDREIQTVETGLKLTEDHRRSRKYFGKDTNAGGRNPWTHGFFDNPGKPVWRALWDANHCG